MRRGKLRKHRKTPCRACPWRTEAGAGWLGGASPERFVLAILADDPLPCHLTIDYDDPRWKEAWLEEKAGKLCAGALIATANLMKRPRDPRIPCLGPSTEVFKTPQAFIDHHRQVPGIRSWSDAEDAKGLWAWERFKKFPIASVVLVMMDSPEVAEELGVEGRSRRTRTK